MDSPTPVNVSALLGCIGIAQPMIFVPTSDKHGHRYATWDKVSHSADDKQTAFHIAWLFSGIPAEESGIADQVYHHKGPWNVGPIEDPKPVIDDSQFAWMVALRAATLFNAVHDEAHFTI